MQLDYVEECFKLIVGPEDRRRYLKSRDILLAFHNLPESRGEHSIKATPYSATALTRDFALPATPAAAGALARLSAPPPHAFYPELPERIPGFTGTLQAHQRKVGGKLLAEERGLVWWEMGLGKTQLAIAAFLAARAAGKARRCLVIVPASLRRDVWERELAGVTDVPFAVADGDASSRRAIYADLDQVFVILSFEAARIDKKLLADAPFEGVVVDESSMIKNKESQNYRASLAATPALRFGFLLNGTAVENNYEEFYAQLRWLFGSEIDFKLLDWIANYSHSETRDALFARYLTPYVSFMRKTDLGDDRPPIEYRHETLQLSGAAALVYERSRAGLAAYLKAREGAAGPEEKRITLAALTRMQQICDHLHLVGGGIDAPSAKLDAVLAHYAWAVAHGKKLIIFTQYAEFAKMIAARMPGSVLYIGGVSKADRQAAFERYRIDPACSTFIMTTAGARGLNLEMTDRIVIADPLWNPATLAQIVGRGDRLTRSKALEIVMLLTEGTLEEKKYSRMFAKERRADALGGALGGEDAPEELARESGLSWTLDLLKEREGSGSTC